MARRSLRPHLNQIRGWVRQGRTDAWIAHQLEVTVQQIEQFKRENSLEADGDGGEVAAGTGTDFDDEIDLRAEDDALIAAELEREAGEADDEDEGDDGEKGDDEDRPAARRRRGRRGGRRRGGARTGANVLEGTFDHGEEGYGLWMDPAVADSPIYAEHWAGHRPVEVTDEYTQIVIRRAGESADAPDADE
jgi:hypothetical protein